MSDTPKVTRDILFAVGQVVKHRVFPFRGVIYDVDPLFNNTEEWWQSIPEEIRPAKEQPYYHLFAVNDRTSYIAYVSQQNILPDDSGKPVDHPEVDDLFGAFDGATYALADHMRN